MEEIWNNLITRLTPFQVAGIMGNMQSESGFDPYIVQGGGHSQNPSVAGEGVGYGLVQWTPGSKLTTLLAGKPPTIPNQIDALWVQLTGTGAHSEKKAGDNLRATTSIDDATVVFELQYERHAGGAQPARKTQAHAIHKLAQEKGWNMGTAVVVPVGSGGPGGGPGGGPASTTPQSAANCTAPAGAGGVGCTNGANILPVPPGGKGTPACYFNQSDLSGGNYDWPECGCLPTSALIIRASVENNPTLDPVSVLEGVRSKGGVHEGGCLGVHGGAINYIQSLGYQTQTIVPWHGTITDASIATITNMLGQGFMFMTHTSKSIDSAGSKDTPGHFLVIHAVDAQGNFYVANPGARADNNKPVPASRVKVWLDMAVAFKK